MEREGVSDRESTPAGMEASLRRLVAEIRRGSPGNRTVFGYFHIRRTDSQPRCDSEIPKVKEYLRCSLEGTERFKNVTILFASDEKDETYRRNVTGLLDAYPR